MSELVDNNALRVLDTIVSCRREPNGRALQKWVQSFILLSKLAMTFKVELPGSIWYYVFMWGT